MLVKMCAASGTLQMALFHGMNFPVKQKWRAIRCQHCGSTRHCAICKQKKKAPEVILLSTLAFDTRYLIPV